MNIAAMAVITLLVFAEKTLPWGRPVAAPRPPRWSPTALRCWSSRSPAHLHGGRRHGPAGRVDPHADAVTLPEEAGHAIREQPRYSYSL